ncbi:hypothetical protein BTM25_09550 [Actinomadura rubteroloni]|uniref:Uncharacterized protein n=1 Tax=Actinomadura rubteroloni TaxID=1926885 RepID=A0A2P4UNC9_9ACTN|nr:hypothetical protein [Actinomadura rubteroloni]POM26554.1 hypothetical protein BTM25_09550 [Actinomadura rubteroloni]
MNDNRRSARELAEELASNPDDPRFRNRRPGIRATRRISREDADADTAGMEGGFGTTGGGSPGGSGFGRTQGHAVPDTPPGDEFGEPSTDDGDIPRP